MTASGRVVSALLRSCHPLPTVAVTAFTAALGLAAGLDGGQALLLVAAVLTGQLSIGWLNDAVDADLDRAGERTDKPVAAGEVSRRTVATAAVLAAVVTVPLSLALGLLRRVTRPARLRLISHRASTTSATTPTAMSKPTNSPPSCQTRIPSTTPPMPTTDRGRRRCRPCGSRCKRRREPTELAQHDDDDHDLQREADPPRQVGRDEPAEEWTDRSRDGGRGTDQCVRLLPGSKRRPGPPVPRRRQRRRHPRLKIYEVMAPMVDTPFAQHVVSDKKVPPGEITQAVLDGLEADDLEMHVGITADLYPVCRKSPLDALRIINANTGG